MQVASATASGIVGNAIEPMPMPVTMQQASNTTHMIWLTPRRRKSTFRFIAVLTTPAGARQKKCGGTAVVPGKKKRREGVLFLAVVG